MAFWIAIAAVFVALIPVFLRAKQQADERRARDGGSAGTDGGHSDSRDSDSNDGDSSDADGSGDDGGGDGGGGDGD